MSDTCPYCGAALLVQDRFCPGCGQPASLVGGSSPPGLPTSFLQAPTVRSAPSLAADDVSIPPPPPDSYILYAPLSGSSTIYQPPAPPVLVFVPTRKKHRWLWGLLLIPLALLIGGIVALVIFSFTPTSTLQNYCYDLTGGNYQGIYALYSTSYQSQVGSEQSFALAAERANGSKGGVTNCTVGSVSSANQAASGIVTVTYGNGSTTTFLIRLDHTTGVWKISDIT
jgi:hypothetical protein